MYYDKEFDEYEASLFLGATLNNYLIALELKNIANELHEMNELTLQSQPTHMTLDSNGATIHYGVEKGE